MIACDKPFELKNKYVYKQYLYEIGQRQMLFVSVQQMEERG